MAAVETISNLIFSGPLAWTADASCQGRSELFFAPAGERPEARVLREGQARSVCTGVSRGAGMPRLGAREPGVRLLGR